MNVVVTCSGLSNTGKLTTQVVVTLLRHNPGMLDWVKAGTEPDRLRRTLETADQVIAISGCADCCARKKIEVLGVIPDREVIATELGVVKNSMADPAYAEIDLVVQAVREALNRREKETS